MSWILIVFVSLSHFANGDDVWVTMPDESVIAFFHDPGGFHFVGTYLSYVCPQTGITRIDTNQNGCDIAIGWDKDSVRFQWYPKVLGQDEDGGFIVEQTNCRIFTLWSFQ